MSEFKDFYAELNISREATSQEIKTAYRDLALQFHPDQNESEEAHVRFLAISDAYQVLSQPASRSKYNIRYDQYHNLRPQNTASEGYANLKRVRRKRASRYNRSMYAQRMRYRGGSTSASPTPPPPPQDTEFNQAYKQAYQARQHASVERAIAEQEARIQSFKYLAFILRVVAVGIFLFIGALLADKYLAERMPSEYIELQKPMVWSFSTPGTLEIRTSKSIFGVEKKYGEQLEFGQEVILKKSPVGKIPVAAFIVNEGEEIPLKVYGTLYAPPFNSLWIVFILAISTFFTARNPEYNVYLGILTLIMMGIVGGIVFF